MPKKTKWPRLERREGRVPRAQEIFSTQCPRCGTEIETSEKEGRCPGCGRMFEISWPQGSGRAGKVEEKP